MSSSLGVYISVPFCKAKCTFCNFASGAFAPGRMQHYVDRVKSLLTLFLNLRDRSGDHL